MMRQQLAKIKTPTNNVIAQLMALMFFSSIGRGFSAPYINLYLDDIGVSATIIGTIVGIAALVELSFSPFLNNLADRHKRHRLLLVFQYSAYALGTFFVAMTTNVWFLGLIVILIELGKRSAIVLSLQLTLIKLEEINRDIIGRVRSFNAMGFSLANIFQGTIFLASGFMGMFVVSGFFTASSIWFMRVLPKQATTRKNDKTLAPRQRKFYFMVLIQIFVMLGQRSGFAFWLIHFTNNLGVYVEDIGILVAIWAFAEIPFFMLFDPIIKRFDVRITYIIGASGMGIMWFLVSIVPSPAWLIPILLMRGLVFSLLNMSTLVLISRISDPRNVATNQSLLQVTVPGLAMLFGAPIMGWFFDTYPPHIFFGLCLMFMAVGSLIMIIVYRHLTPTLIEIVGDDVP